MPRREKIKQEKLSFNLILVNNAGRIFYSNVSLCLRILRGHFVIAFCSWPPNLRLEIFNH